MARVNDVYFVNIYEIDRVYGGPEEGGWYYNTGIPVNKDLDKTVFEKQAIFTEYAEAYDYAQEIEEELEELNRIRGNRPPHSVLSNGEWLSVVVEDQPAKKYPDVIPHYE